MSKMIKKIFLISTIIIAYLNSYAQQNNEFRVYYGISGGQFMRNESLIGGASFELENLNEFGISYLRKINDRLSLRTGMNYANANLIITPEFMGTPVKQKKEDFELISIPVLASYTFWKFISLNGGLLLDFQSSENTTDLQSGIGYQIGLGGKFNFHQFSIFLKPNFKKHAWVPFEKENLHQKLSEFGIQFGVGYRF